MKTSVILITFNRAHLLKRSLACYLLGAEKTGFKDFEIIVVDDDSTDDTGDLCYDWMSSLDIKYIKIRKPEGVGWRDCGVNLNLGIRAAKGEVILLTHPEVMPGNETLWRATYATRDGLYVCAKPYYLTVDQQATIDTVPWNTEGVLAVRKLPDFYTYDQAAEFRGNPDYVHKNIERTGNWESWVFGGLSRNTWKAIGGMRETQSWGAVDIEFLARRNALGIANKTLMEKDTLCIHQNHDLPGVDILTPRIEQVWRDELDSMFRERQNVICNNLW